MSSILYRAIELILSGDREVMYITFTSLSLGTASTFFAAVLGISAAMVLRLKRFAGRRAIIIFLNGLMAMPTVVIGLTVYAILSRSGPLGPWGLLYSGKAVIIGQTLLAFPIVTSLTYSALNTGSDVLLETLHTMGITGLKKVFIILDEIRYPVLMAVVAGLGRVIGEVGVSMMLGGNIRWNTRTITTAIALETGKGEFEQAMALGIILIVVSLGINTILRLGAKDDF